LARGTAIEDMKMVFSPCHCGLVFALGIEAGGLQDLLDGLVTTRGPGFVARQGTLGDRQVVLMLSGPGRASAARATEALLDGHRPELVISAGFAGGLDPKLQRGDIVLADTLLDEAAGSFAMQRNLVPAALAATRGVYLGRLLTVDRIICLPEEKRALGVAHGALAVDMETFAVAEVCRRREVPLMAVRAISDTADDLLPPDLERLIAQKTAAARWGAALGSILKRPSRVKDLLVLQHRALEAAERLAQFLAALIGQSGSGATRLESEG
jgi:adenosylhomocysteine nucleosidase